MLSMSKRTVRFYIQQALVDRPEGQRRGAYYTDNHLRQLSQVKEWQQSGFSLERIRSLQEQGLTPGETLPSAEPARGSISVWSRIHMSQGIELHINPELAGLNQAEVSQLYKQIDEKLM